MPASKLLASTEKAHLKITGLINSKPKVAGLLAQSACVAVHAGGHVIFYDLPAGSSSCAFQTKADSLSDYLLTLSQSGLLCHEQMSAEAKRYRSWFEAYSRGKLPETVFIPLTSLTLSEQVQPVAQFLKTLSHMGHPMPDGYNLSSSITAGASLSETCPNIVLLGSGLLIRLFQRAFLHHVKRLAAAYPASQLLHYMSPQLLRLLVLQEKAALKTKPQYNFQLAGSLGPALHHVAYFLEQHQCKPHLEALGHNPAERLEWQNLLIKHVSSIPAAQQQKLLKIWLQLGEHMQLLYSNEASLESIYAQGLLTQAQKKEKQPLTNEDRIGLRLLAGYGQEYNLIPASSVACFIDEIGHQ